MTLNARLRFVYLSPACSAECPPYDCRLRRHPAKHGTSLCVLRHSKGLED